MSRPTPTFHVDPDESAVSSVDSPSPRIALLGPRTDGDLLLYAAAFEDIGAAVSIFDPVDASGGIFVTPIVWQGGTSCDPVLDYDAYFAPYLGPSHPRRALVDVFAAAGLPTINLTAAKVIAEDKWATTCRLASAGLPQPRTLLVTSGPSQGMERLAAAQAIGLPVVLKAPFGYNGTGVALAHDADAIERFVVAHGLGGDDSLLIQEFYAEAGGRDVRIVVLDDEILAVKSRWSGSDAEFRSATLDNVVEAGSLVPEERDMAIDACRAVGLDFAGVDLIRTANGPIILELNNAPSLSQTQRVCRVDIARAVALALVRRTLMRS